MKTIPKTILMIGMEIMNKRTIFQPRVIKAYGNSLKKMSILIVKQFGSKLKLHVHNSSKIHKALAQPPFKF